MRCEYIREHGEDVWVKCPICEGESLILQTIVSMVNGATFNCSDCGELLVGIEHEGVHVSAPLHQWISLHEPRWPIDGAGTMCIDVPYYNRSF